jgi:hypothetical protein
VSGISNDPDDLLNVLEARVDPDDDSTAGPLSPPASEVDPGAGDRLSTRPILVEVASLIFARVGFFEILMATLIFTSYGLTSLVVGLPLGLLAAGAIVMAVRIRAGRSRRAALTVALVTLVAVPATLGVDLFGLAVGVSMMIATIALVRYRAWFGGTAPAA